MKESIILYVLMGMKQITLSVFAVLLFATPIAAVEAKYRAEVAAWVPWFGGEEAVERATAEMSSLDTVYPFVFEVTADGSLRNRADFTDDHWEDLFAEAEDERVDVIPTIAWFEAAEMHAVLSDTKQRRAHIKEIVTMVEDNDFAGVDIDYEGKWARTIDDFSTFLKELERALGREDLVCTLEARTPPEDLYRTVPSPLEYANDYDAINRYCDRVQIMAYDQQRADLTLNDQRRGVPYAPVADEDWVEKVIELALEDIDEDKLMLGIPTYGRAWDVTVASEWYRDYDNVAALNHERIEELVDIYDATVGRTAGGEAVISYFPETSPWAFLNGFKGMPKDTPKGFERAALALALATALDIEIPVRVVIWSDDEAVEGKLDIAEKYDLEGVSLFSVNGKEDREIWRLF